MAPLSIKRTLQVVSLIRTLTRNSQWVPGGAVFVPDQMATDIRNGILIFVIVGLNPVARYA